VPNPNPNQNQKPNPKTQMRLQIKAWGWHWMKGACQQIGGVAGALDRFVEQEDKA